MKQRIALPKKAWAVAALLLALVLALVCQLPMRSQAASYLDTYLERMVDLGLMQGDPSGNLRPNDSITRSEFVTIVNRAFGYNATAGYPFVDVHSSDWFSEDVDISYTEGYITGTTPTTFSPNVSITREEAAFILAKNLMMEPSVGEDLSFTDSRNISTWSRGLVSTAARYNLISGYPDGSFVPQRAITRGEAAVLLLNAVGTLVQEPGVQTLGDVWGNVTITTSGVTLRNTMVAGNLYITAGVGLGGVTLENVTVLGEIIVSGGGVSEAGDDSIIFRNVTAPSLVLDNITNQQVSLRVEGNGVINEASVRTNAVVTDAAADGRGVLSMELNGEEGLSLDVAGNIKEVVNRTPGSALNVASGQAAVITVDETATDSTLNISSGASVGQVNLDVGTTVTGDGDIDNLVVNAPGSTVSMLPDQITIRPGVTADIDGETMDSEAAAESSADPRLLAGYPQITNLAPNTATAVFSGNKSGTVHWAVTSVTDGSADVSELLNPPAYGGGIVQNGTVNLSGSSQPVQANLTGLTSDGSYYLAAVMVDARGDQSPLKVISFTTPDNTVPRFADGYPYMSQITNVSGQAAVMATKTCRLYWAVLPDGAAAPTAQDFRANAVTGNLGFGSMDVTKNTSYTIDVNNVPLTELETYDLYLWLTDVDGGQSSAVQHLEFTTVDRTPPVFNTEPTVNNVQNNSVGLYANLNEDGTLFWVVVAQGEEYPKPLAGQSGEVSWTSNEAKIQVANGRNALVSGRVTMREGQDVSFTVSGLQPETAYDLYFVAQDTAGNYTASIDMITIHTLDSNAPTVTQEFTEPSDDPLRPFANTSVELIFSEEVQDAATNVTLVEYYNRVSSNPSDTAARDQLASILRNSIKLYVDTGSGRPTEVVDASAPENTLTETQKTNGENWVIDYRYARVELREGQTVVTFPTVENSPATSALNLASGATYYFEIQSNTLADTSDAKNVIRPAIQLDRFTTVFALVNVFNLNENTITEYTNFDTPDEPAITPTTPIDVDMSWYLDPASTDSVAESIDWDMLILTDTSVAFNLYRRTVTDISTATGPWELLNSSPVVVTVSGDEMEGVSLTRNFLKKNTNNPIFDSLNELAEGSYYEYAISFTSVAGLSDRNTWSQRINAEVYIVAGSTGELQFLSADVIESNIESALNDTVTGIGVPNPYTTRKQFTDNVAPTFIGQYPQFDVGDSAVQMNLMLDRPGTVYYVVAPQAYIDTKGENGSIDYGEDTNWVTLPCPVIDSTGQVEPIPPDNTSPQLTDPDYLNIVNASTNYRNERIKYGSITCGSSVETVLVDGLDKTQNYTVYFVLQGTSQTYSDVFAYRFTTEDVQKPVLTLYNYSPSVNFQSDSSANVNYALIASNEVPAIMQAANGFDNYIDPEKQDRWDTLTQTGGNYTSEDRTILWALCNTYGTEGYSIFDEFADDSIRNTVTNLISGTVTGGADLTPGTLSLTQANGYQQERDFTDRMTGGTIYYCLATAVSPLGSETSFAGVAGIQIRDTTPPELQFVNTVARPSTNDPSLYTGSVTFVFDEPIYQLVSKNGVDQKPMEVWQTQYSMSDADKQIAVNLPDIIGTSATGSFSCESNVREAVSSLTLHFEDIPLNTTLVLFSNSYICDVNSSSTRQNLSFILQQGYIGNIPGGITFVQQER